MTRHGMTWVQARQRELEPNAKTFEKVERMATEKAAEVVTRERLLGTHGALGLVAGVSEPPHVGGAWRAVGLAPVLIALGHKHVVHTNAKPITSETWPNARGNVCLTLCRPHPAPVAYIPGKCLDQVPE